MKLFDNSKVEFPGHHNTLSAKETINEFFHTFHQVEAEEMLRELLKIIMNPQINTTDQEKEEFAYFLQRLSDLVQACHTLKS